MSILEERRKLFTAQSRRSRKSGSWWPVVLGGALIALIAGYLAISAYQRNAARQAELDRVQREKEQMDKMIREFLKDPEREAIVKQADEKRRARLADFASRNVPFQDCAACSGNGWVKVLVEVRGYEKNTGRTHECRGCRGEGVVEIRICPSCENKKDHCETCGGKFPRKSR